MELFSFEKFIFIFLKKGGEGKEKGITFKGFFFSCCCCFSLALSNVFIISKLIATYKNMPRKWNISDKNNKIIIMKSLHIFSRKFNVISNKTKKRFYLWIPIYRRDSSLKILKHSFSKINKPIRDIWAKSIKRIRQLCQKHKKKIFVPIVCF